MYSVIFLIYDLSFSYESRFDAFVLGGKAPLKGDLLVIAGATLYGVSNVSEESTY